jgi:SAM-dependent methyltransferase
VIPKDVEYLKCINCGHDLLLKVFETEKDECVEGKLSCKHCNEEWPVINAIPRLLPKNLLKNLVLPYHKDFFDKYHFDVSEKNRSDKSSNDDKLKSKTAQSFGFEWLKYPKILNQFEKDWERYFHPFITRKDIKGSVVADFGCGMAKHGYFIGKYASKKYIGLDLSEATEAAYRNTKKFKPLIVQADIYHIPLKGEKIDICYSIGVLHHLPNPENGFISIIKNMRKGSKIFMWVYGQRGNSRALYLYNPIRFVTTRMNRKFLYNLCHIPAIAVHSLNSVSKGLSKIGLKKSARLIPFSYYTDFPYTFKVSDTFDTLGTPTQIYYKMSEIDSWFKHSKLKKYQLEYDVVQGIKGYGVK